jgi:hypothetical protein
MSRRTMVVVVSLLSIGLAGVVSADDGWSLSKLNPFKKSPAPQRTRASVSDHATRSGTNHMNVPPWTARPASTTRRNEPSTLEKINQGTKDFFGKTKEVLMPWSSSSKKPASRAGSRQPAKTSWFSSWFPEKKKEPEIRTVNDFLSLERPQF